MPSIFKGFVLFSLALSASALTTPHAARYIHHHRAVAAALVTATPEPVVAQDALAARTVRRRSNGGRCKPKSSSSSSSATLAAATPAANVEGAPPSASSSKSSPKATHKAAKATHTSSSDEPASTKHDSSGKPASSNGGGGANLPSFMKGTQTGQGTYYGTGLGACGITNNDNQHIAAVSHLLFDTYPGYNGANPNQNPICGQKVTATYQGKSVEVTITDRCQACKITDLDFSPSAFSQIADQALGRISGMKWVWNN